MSEALQLAELVQEAWSDVSPPHPDEMDYFILGWGRDAQSVFVGVSPSEVDIDAPKFLSSAPLHELGGHAASAYLGPYLRAFLQDVAFQEKVGMPTEPLLRAHVISFLTYRLTWPDQLQPWLSLKQIQALGQVVQYIVKNEDLLALNDEQREAFRRLLKLVDKQIEKSV